MKAFAPESLRGGLMLFLCLGLGTASGQFLYQAPPEEPQFFKMRVTDASVGVYSEGVFEQDRFGGSSTVDYSRLFIGPSLGLGLEGSIYHPNLARYVVNSEGAFGYAEERVDSTTTLRRNEFEYLGNFQSSIYLLDTKPYASTLSAGLDHTYRDYDFFNRTTVDTSHYGAQTGYREGPVAFTVSVEHQDEREDYISSVVAVTNVAGGVTNVGSRPVFASSSLQQNSLTFDASDERASGNTRFNYALNDYSRADFGARSEGTDHVLGLADGETFGARRQITWNNNAGYTLRRFTEAPSDDLNVDSHLAIEHTPAVSTFYDADYYRDTYGPSTSDSYNGSGSVRHQLYESLTSTLRFTGQRAEFSGPGGSSDTTQFGGALNEGYTKHLSSWARLNIGGSVELDHTEVNQAGTVIPVVDEAHSFTSGSGGGPADTFPLNLPNVDATTIRVTDAHDALTYIEGFDYSVSRNGLLTYISKIVGSRIPDNTTLHVSYSATPSPSGSYDSVLGAVQVRLDFWNGLLGVYGRLNSVQNHGTPGLIVQDLTAWDFGADTTWRFLRAGAEYEIYDSSFSSYRTARLFESLMFKMDEASTLNLDFSQAWTTYLEADRKEQLYSFITRYHRRLTAHLGGDLEGGVSLRQGAGVDQTLATCRPGLEFAMGQFSFKVGYDFEYQKFLETQEQFKHLFFLRMKRTF